MDGLAAADYPLPPKIHRRMLSHHVVNLSKKRKLLAEAIESSDSPPLKHVCCTTRFDVISEDPLHCRDIHLENDGGKDIPDSNHHADQRMESVEDFANSSTDSCIQGAARARNINSETPQSLDHPPISCCSLSGGPVAATSSSSSDTDTDTVGYRQNPELHHSDLITDELGMYMDSMASALRVKGKHKTDDDDEEDDDALQDFIFSTNGLILDPQMVSTDKINGDDDAGIQQLAACKPTIDQEFEDYFSSLML